MGKKFQIQSWPTNEIFIQIVADPFYVDFANVSVELSSVIAIYELDAPAQNDSLNTAVKLSSVSVATNPISVVADNASASVFLNSVQIISAVVSNNVESPNVNVTLSSIVIILPSIAAVPDNAIVSIRLSSAI